MTVLFSQEQKQIHSLWKIHRHTRKYAQPNNNERDNCIQPHSPTQYTKTNCLYKAFSPSILFPSSSSSFSYYLLLLLLLDCELLLYYRLTNFIEIVLCLSAINVYSLNEHLNAHLESVERQIFITMSLCSLAVCFISNKHCDFPSILSSMKSFI